jgi:MFS family permease
MSAKTAIALLGQRRFFPLMSAQAMGAFNDNLYRFALVNLATFQGLTVFGLSRDLMVPIAATALTLPIFLFSAVAGQVADRYDRALIMRRAKLAEIALMLVASVGFLLGEALILITVLFLMGLQSAFFAPARNAALPTVLDDTELVTGNALVQGSLNVAILAGAGLATVLVVQDNAAAMISGALVCMAVAGWGVMRLNTPAPADNPDLRINWNIATETWRMLGFAFRDAKVLRPMLGVAWFWMLAACVVTLMPLFAASVLGGDESVNLLMTVIFTLSAALGAILCGVLRQGVDTLWLSMTGAVGLVVFPLFTALSTLGWEGDEDALLGAAAFAADPAHWPVLGALALSAVSAGLFFVPLQAMLQRRAKPELRGRTLAASGILNAATASIGQFALLGLGLVVLPIQTAFIVIAAVSALAAGFIGWRMAARRRGAGAA